MAAGNTYVALATNTLSSATASVTFSSISGSYTDLVLVFAGTATTFADATLRFNADSGSNYSDTILYGSGTVAGSGRHSNQTFPRGFYASTTQCVNIWNIMNYSNATTYKTVIGRSNTSANEVDAAVNLWRSTSAITSIQVIADSNTFATGSTFSLYGIAAA